MDQTVDQVVLPLSGLTAELLISSVGLLHWRLSPVRPAAAPLERTPILGWRFGCRTDGRGRPVRYTVAWGSLSGGGGLLRVVVVRDRRLRAVLRRALEPVTLGDAFWIAEAPGRYDRVVVADGAVVESREMAVPAAPAPAAVAAPGP